MSNPATARPGHRCSEGIPIRTFGRIYALNADGSRQKPQPAGYPQWTEVTTDSNGFNDAVMITTLAQVLQLNLNESPKYANYGLPDQQAVISQVQPDFYAARTQQLFAQYFASLIIAKVPNVDEPTYNVAVLTNQGSRVIVQVPT